MDHTIAPSNPFARSIFLHPSKPSRSLGKSRVSCISRVEISSRAQTFFSALCQICAKPSGFSTQAGMWVFDDARVGLDKEPFVSRADTMV
jgi:hypothetical protein